MKIKSLSLLLIIAGIILISGCLENEAQPLNNKVPEDLMYRSIFYPYPELSDLGGPGMPGMHPHDSHPRGPHTDPESIHNFSEAKYILDSNIEKAERISTRIEEGIQRLKAEGEDVSRLEALLEEYNALVEDAKEYRALANEAAEGMNNSSITDSEYGSSENMEMEYLIESQKSMVHANHVLKEIFEEFQSLSPGNEELNSTSLLRASGEGKALMAGSFDLYIHLENGVIAIPELSPDSELYIKGDYTIEENDHMQDELLVYDIQSADVKIYGSHKIVMLNGTNITLNTDGEGFLALMGNGTYSIEDAGKIIKEESWGTPFFEEESNPDEFGPRGEDNDSVAGHKAGNFITEEYETESNIAEENSIGMEPGDRRSFIK